MIEKEGVIRMCKDDISPQKRSLQKGMVRIHFLEDVIVPMYESKLTITFST